MQNEHVEGGHLGAVPELFGGEMHISTQRVKHGVHFDETIL